MRRPSSIGVVGFLRYTVMSQKKGTVKNNHVSWYLHKQTLKGNLLCRDTVGGQGGSEVDRATERFDYVSLWTGF